LFFSSFFSKVRIKIEKKKDEKVKKINATTFILLMRFRLRLSYPPNKHQIQPISQVLLITDQRMLDQVFVGLNFGTMA
jgi:hypothetical protein